jgi:hypothetical protein
MRKRNAKANNVFFANKIADIWKCLELFEYF